MAYAPHGDPDPSRWQRELEQLTYMNHQLRRELEDTRAALQDATKDAVAAREESADLKHKIELFWDNIEDARATFVRSFPNYASYRESHKRSREADERDRLSRKSQRTDPHSAASGSGTVIAPGPPREPRRGPRPHDYPPEAAGAYPPSHESQYRTHPRGQPHLTVPAPGPSDKHAHPNGRSPYDTHPPGSFPDPAHPHVDGPRGPSISPHLATRIPSHQGHRHAPSDPNAYPLPEAQGYPTHSRRESSDALPIPRQRRPANAEQATSRSSPSPSAAQHVPGLDNNPNRPALPPAGAIIIHPPAAFQVSFTDLQPGIFLDRVDFGAEYPPNLDPPQGLQAVRCLFCDKHYSGANARSLWRRHVMGKHDFTMKGQRASTVRNRHMGSLSTNGEPLEPAPASSIPSASPVQPQVQASSRSFENRAPASQRPASPGHKHPNRASRETDQLESEDDQEAFDYQRHRGGTSRELRKAPDADAGSGANGHSSGAGSPLTHAALETWTKGPGGSSVGDVARWQGQGSVPGKTQGQGQGQASNRREDEEEQADGTPEVGASTGQDKQREWCLCRRPDSWGDMIRCDMPTCAIQWYHARCVGLDRHQAQQKDEWFCEDCSRKAAQRRKDAHRDGPPPKDRTPVPRPAAEQAPPAQPQPQPNADPRPESRNKDKQDEDVVMHSAEQDNRTSGEADAASKASDEEHARHGSSNVPRKINVRRVLSESQSPKPTGEAGTDARSEPPSAHAPTVSLPRDGVRKSEPLDDDGSTASPQRKRGWKGYALVPVPDAGGAKVRSEHGSQTVTTPGGTRRTRSGKTYVAEDGVSASDGVSERQQSMETN